MSRSYVFIIFGLAGIGFIQGSYKFGALKCKNYVPDVGQLTVCEIKEIDEHRNMINIEGYLNKTVSQLEISFKMRKRNAGLLQPNAFDITVDVCQFFKNRALYVIPNLVYTFIKPYTNINHTCPYLAGSQIRLWEYTLDDGGIMSKFPMERGEYSGSVTYLINKVPSMTINGSVTFF